MAKKTQKIIEPVPGWQAQGFAVDPNPTAAGLNDEQRIEAMHEEAEFRGVSGPGYVNYTEGETE